MAEGGRGPRGEGLMAENENEKVGESTASVRENTLSGTQMPKIDFSTFIFSLNSSVLVQLGLLEEPGTNQKTKNLPLAKQTIDIMTMLEEKTRGNLTKDEENLLKSILYDLRILYVKEKG
jgi:hypothetical protein